MSETREAPIQIGDQVLTEAQSMAVRVAISCFLIDLNDEEFKRELGPIAELYAARLLEVTGAMVAAGLR